MSAAQAAHAGGNHHNTTNTNSATGGAGGSAAASSTSGASATGVGVGIGGSSTSGSYSGGSTSGAISGGSTSGATIGDVGAYQGQGQDAHVGGNNTQINAPSAAPPVIAPALIASPIVCMGSVSGGASASTGIVGAGVSFGKTYTDATCERVVLSNALRALGQTDAALEILAADPRVAKALGRTPPVKNADGTLSYSKVTERATTDFGQR